MNGTLRLWILLLAVALYATPVGAAITLTGDTSPATTGGADPWNVGNPLTVGASATGSVTIDGGSDVTDTSVNVGNFGTATLSGAGSTWVTGPSDFAVGGNGNVSVLFNGALTSKNGSIGVGASTGVSVVTVDDSSWSVTGELQVGHNANGTLNLSNGSKVTCSNLIVGFEQNSGQVTATVNVDTGSTLTASSFIQFGSASGAPTGILKISNQSVVSTPTISQVSPNASIVFNGGTLSLTATGNLTVPTTLNSGGGTIQVPTTGTTVTAATNGISGAGKLTKTGAGKLLLTAANTYSGATYLLGGTFALAGNGSFASSPSINIYPGSTLDVSGVTGGANYSAGFTLVNGQTLTGDGSVVGFVKVASGATLSPGFSTSTLNTNSVTLSGPNSKFLAEFNPAKIQADLLNVAGTVNVGNSTLALSFLSSLSGHSPYTVELIANDSTDAIVDRFGSITGVPSGYSATINYAFTGTDSLGRVGNGNDLAIVFTPVPEPNGLVLAGIATLALGLCGGRIRRLASVH